MQSGIYKTFLSWFRKVIIIFSQTLIILAAFISALYLRFHHNLPVGFFHYFDQILFILIVVKLICFGFFRMFSGWWRYVSLPDLILLVKANLVASFFVFFLLQVVGPFPDLPWSVLTLDGLLCLLFMAGIRVSVRIARESFRQKRGRFSGNFERTLIVGAGAAGQSLVREIHQNPKLRMQVVGFADQDHDRLKEYFQGHPVLGKIEEIPCILRKYSIDQVLLANPALTRKKLGEILAFCRDAGIKAKILPKVDEILSGSVAIQHVREVRLEDLLGRPSVQLDLMAIRHCFGDKVIMVTGAAGSIGSEICRQVARFGARSIILFDYAETPLFEAERDLREEFPTIEFKITLSDVRKKEEIKHVLNQYRPEVIFHAAAYKHVPMAEENPVTAIENNVLGTRNLVEAADCAGVDRFIMISTDKAVNPTNIMGASKRAAEICVQALARTSQTQMITVRFGNVLGSNGSVVPIFQKQISRGGPVTVTHPEATRYFMTIPEAVELVLQAASMGQGGEIFLLDMGDQVPIVKLAEELILLSGLKPYEDIDIVFTGMRPGEKMQEELLLAEEGIVPTKHSSICVARATFNNPVGLGEKLDQLAESCRRMDRMTAVNHLIGLVPQYQASNLGKKTLNQPAPATPEQGLLPAVKGRLASTV